MSKIHVAIIGAGIGGGSLACALLRHSHITFDLYEYKSDFNQQGAVVSLSQSARSSLQMIGFDVDELLKQLGGIPYSTTTSAVGNAPEGVGAKPATLDGVYTVNVSRSKLLHAILGGVPKDRIHNSRRLLKIEKLNHFEGSHANMLFFEDGSTATADVVIGMDGIRSTTRKIILGENHPRLSPIFSGFWWCQNTVDYKKASDMMDGYEIPPGMLSIYGAGGYLMCLCIDGGKKAAPYAVGVADKWEGPWARTMPKEEFYAFFKHWSKFSHGLMDVIADQDEITIWSEWESDMAPTYSSGAICMAGDAAHAPCPWGAHGAALALEDSLILSELLNVCRGPADVLKAFKVYDAIRIPRTQAVIKASREIGEIFCGSWPDIGIDAAKMAPPLLERSRALRDIDMNIHLQEALALFHQD